MQSSPSSHETLISSRLPCVSFGECEFDSGRRVLLRHGSVTPLSLKAFQLLELLLDRRPEAVAKTELLERLWPETFVSDASLHNLVAEIRAALGDAPRRRGTSGRSRDTAMRFTVMRGRRPRPASSRPDASGPRLVSRHREWLLSEGSNLVGRDRDCAVRIDSATLSRHHARIVVTSGEATVEDLGSKNGTHVNGQRVKQPVALKDGDRIQFRLCHDDVPDSCIRSHPPLLGECDKLRATSRQTPTLFGLWSRRSDLNRGPADYEKPPMPSSSTYQHVTC